MAARQMQSTAPSGEVPEVFDRAHLSHYTMENADLEREILDLFLTQLPLTIAMIEAAQSLADWKLHTHTLKGSAAAIGARRLQSIAVDLEELGFDGDLQIRALRVSVLHAAAAEFRGAVRHIVT